MRKVSLNLAILWVVSWNIWFQSLLWFSFFELCNCLMCTKSFSPPIRLRIQGNKEKISSLVSYTALPACLYTALKFFSVRAGHKIVFNLPPQRFFQSFLAFGLLSDVRFCMDILPVIPCTAYLDAKVDFWLLSLLLCPPLFYELTDSNHNFNSYFNRPFRAKNYEKWVSIVVRTDSRAILYLGLDFCLWLWLALCPRVIYSHSLCFHFFVYKTEMIIIEPTS